MYMNTDYHSLFLSAANEREKETKTTIYLCSMAMAVVLYWIVLYIFGGSKPMSAGSTACTRPKKNTYRVSRRESLVMATCMHTI